MRDITPGQIIAINRLVGMVAKTRDARLYIVSRLIDRDITSAGELTRADWVKIREDAYSFWKDDDWTVGEEFKRKLAGLHHRFQEEILGQLRLF